MRTLAKFFSPELSAWDKVGQATALAMIFFIPISTSLTSILMSIVLIAWLLGRNYADKRQIMLHHPVISFIYPLVILTGFATIYSVGEHEEIRRGMMDGIRLLFIPVLIYYFQNEKISRIALWLFAAAMILTLILAFLKVYAGLPIGMKYTTGAIFKSHIKTSYFMGVAAFFLALQIKIFPKYRFIFAALALSMVYYLLFMSFGRIGYVTLVVCLLVLAWQWYRIKGVIIAGVIAMAMISGAYFTSSLFHERVNSLAKDMDFYHQGGQWLEQSSLGSRLEFADTSIKLIAQRPWFGWGTGGFGVAYAKIHEGEQTILTDNPHNEYLRAGVEQGILGMSLLFLLFIQHWRLTKSLPNNLRGFCYGLILSFVIGCFINSWLKDFTEGYFYCAMIAVLFAAIPPLPVRKSLVTATLH